MGFLRDSGRCEGVGDCFITSLAFLTVIIAWIVLLCWMACDNLA